MRSTNGDENKRRWLSPKPGSSGSHKSPKIDSWSSPSQSASATPSAGYRKIMERLRSPLRHPLSLPLIGLLNEDTFQRTGKNFPLRNLLFPEAKDVDGSKTKNMLKEFQKKGAEMFQTAVREWHGMGEISLTDKILVKELNQLFVNQLESQEANERSSNLETQEMNQASTESETQESHGNIVSEKSDESALIKPLAQCYLSGINASKGGPQKGYSDMLLYEHSETPTIGRPICLMEFGLARRYKWWGKVCQGCDYVSLLRNPTPNGVAPRSGLKEIRFDGKYPMLLSSIIIDKDKEQEVCGDFGLFLCVPVCSSSDMNGKDFRVIFLWRERVEKTKLENENLHGTSIAFGKILMASCALLAWRKNSKCESFQCLGPNCAKFGDRLLRSYDTRLRATDRSPNLYILPRVEATEANTDSPNDEAYPTVGFHWHPENGSNASQGQSTVDPQGEAAVVVYQVVDGKNPHPFGEPPEGSKQEWLWEKKGKLQIISIPFRQGGHVATKLSDFEPILRHLIHLHDHDMVHGDIRAFNMVFGKEKEQDSAQKRKGWLIDLDFGGKAGSVKYPKNYNARDLSDGRRLGKGGQVISKFEDYYALWTVMSEVHYFEPQNLEGKLYSDFSKKRDEATRVFARGKDDEEARAMLLSLITKYPETELDLHRRFQEVLGDVSGCENPGDDNKNDGDNNADAGNNNNNEGDYDGNDDDNNHNKNAVSPKKTDNTNTEVATGSLRG